MSELLATLPVCAVDLVVLKAGLESGFKDFEDAVQHASAVAAGLEGIITRNVADYGQAALPIYTPSGFLSQFPLTS